MTRLVNTLCMTRPNRKMNLGIAGAITYERIKNRNCVECQTPWCSFDPNIKNFNYLLMASQVLFRDGEQLLSCHHGVLIFQLAPLNEWGMTVS